MPTNFSDLDDTTLDATPAPTTKPTFLEAQIEFAQKDCPKCRGSGRFISYSGRDLGTCNPCGGSGKVKASYKPMARSAVAARETARIDNLAKRRAAFAASHPDVALELAKPPRNEFMQSLATQLAERGELSERQVDAVRNGIARSIARKAEVLAAAPSVAGAGFDRLLAGFAAAQTAGLRRPKVRIVEYTFSLAPATGANANHIYVKKNGEYLGKITPNGQLVRSGACTIADADEIVSIGRDPLAAAIAHGKRTGNCSCCGRHLENAESVRLGIGPICRAKFGW